VATCEVCGNDYDKAFDVVTAGERHTFDSFECAIHRIAPVCEHCGCKTIGHGIESVARVRGRGTVTAGNRPTRQVAWRSARDRSSSTPVLLGHGQHSTRWARSQILSR
jgi:hypothetical protein